MPTGFGSQIDVVVKTDGGFDFYEIKVTYSVRLCIREALAQLLEYSYYPNNNNATRLIVSRPNTITREGESYLKHIRQCFGIPVFYQRYDSEQGALENEVC